VIIIDRFGFFVVDFKRNQSFCWCIWDL